MPTRPDWTLFDLVQHLGDGRCRRIADVGPERALRHFERSTGIDDVAGRLRGGVQSRVNATIEMAGAPEIDRAVRSSWEAHREWMSSTVDRRRDLLIAPADAVQEHADEFDRIHTHDAIPIALSPSHPTRAVRVMAFGRGGASVHSPGASDRWLPARAAWRDQFASTS